MRARSALVLPLAFCALAGCNRINSAQPTNGGQPAAGASGPNATEQDTNVGQPLFGGGAPPVPPPAPRMGGEPIVIPNCYVQYEDRQQVSAEVEGKIEIIGTPLTRLADGRFEWRQPGAEPIIYDPAKPHPS